MVLVHGSYPQTDGSAGVTDFLDVSRSEVWVLNIRVYLLDDRLGYVVFVEFEKRLKEFVRIY